MQSSRAMRLRLFLLAIAGATACWPLDIDGQEHARMSLLWDAFICVSAVVWNVIMIAMVAASMRNFVRPRPAAERAAGERRMLRVVAMVAAATAITLFALIAASITTSKALAMLESQ